MELNEVRTPSKTVGDLLVVDGDYSVEELSELVALTGDVVRHLFLCTAPIFV